MDPKLQEKLDDPQFSALLEASEKFYEDADSYYSWDPPNGQHVVALVKVTEDTVNSKKLKRDVIRVRATAQIMDGEDEGKCFDISGSFGWSPPYLSGLKTLASMMAGEPVMELVPALSVLHQNIGQWFYVTTTRTQAKDGSGKTFVNHRVTDRAQEGASEAPADEGTTEG